MVWQNWFNQTLWPLVKSWFTTWKWQTRNLESRNNVADYAAVAVNRGQRWWFLQHAETLSVWLCHGSSAIYAADMKFDVENTQRYNSDGKDDYNAILFHYFQWKSRHDSWPILVAMFAEKYIRRFCIIALVGRSLLLPNVNRVNRVVVWTDVVGAAGQADSSGGVIRRS